MKHFLMCLLYIAALGVLSFVVGRLIPKHWFHADRFPWVCHPAEQKLWKRLHVRKWQAKIPDMSRIFVKIMPEKKLTKENYENLPRMIEETCVAEWTHILLSIAGLGLLKIWSGVGGVCITMNGYTVMQSNHIKPEVNYREFRIHKLNTPEFSHVRLLLYWPIFGLLFLFLERLQPQRNYYPVYCGLDDIIPFCEWALIPYLFWFVFLIGTLVYTFFVDVPAFRRMMYFVIVTYTITVLIYLFFPTCQNLRPEAFVRNNLLTRFIELFYSFDTNTNVCPSLHVIGSVAAMFGLWDCKALQSVGWKIAATSIAVCISLSTAFMKQHSIMDVLAALPVCFFGWWIAYKILPNNKTNRFLTRM